MKDKIIPSLWFAATSGDVSRINQYYKNIFGENFKAEKIIELGDTPSGKTEFCYVNIFDKKYLFMSTKEAHNNFNDAFSLTIQCENQEEIDRLWNYFTKEGEESMCGWCMDKYGLKWQVIPKNLDELLSRPNGWNVIMGQKKIIISEYLK